MDLSLQVMGITGPHHRTRAQLDDEMTHLRWVPIVHTGTMCVVIEVGNDDGGLSSDSSPRAGGGSELAVGAGRSG